MLKWLIAFNINFRGEGLNLADLREKLDKIDGEIVDLFLARMDIVKEVVRAKRETGHPTLDKARETDKLTALTALVEDKDKDYISWLFNTIFEISRDFQAKNRDDCSVEFLKEANFKDSLSKSAKISVPGVAGSFSEHAAKVMFDLGEMAYHGSFENVFSAVCKGEVSYGVLPIENSTAGSVVEVYNLLNAHQFKIVKSVKCKISHNLAAKNSTKIGDIKEIVSHGQALWQCEKYIKNLGQNIKVTMAENTATAAKMVSESERGDIAAICSEYCADIYGLKILDKNIQDEVHNFTRFICISKNFEIYENSDRISILLTLPHATGSLVQTLKHLQAQGINILKIESRPLPGSEFEFMFYVDIKADILDKNTQVALAQVASESESFRILGCYEEIGED